MSPQTRRGVLAMAAGMASFVANDSLVKYVSETLPSSQLIFIRGVFATVLLLVVCQAMGALGSIRSLGEGLAEHLRSIALPCFCLSVFYMAVLTRMTRSALLEVLGQDYMRTARAAGLPRLLVLRYALRNALVPVVTIAGVSFGHMFGLALIIERVFNIGGMSRALLTAIQQRDYALVQAVVMMFTIIFVLANLVADLLNAWLNPRLAARAA